MTPSPKQAVMSSNKLELQTINSNVCHIEIFGKLLSNKISVREDFKLKKVKLDLWYYIVKLR